MKIAILDGHTVIQNDLALDALSELADVTVYNETPIDKIVERCKDVEMVLTNKVPFDAMTLNMLPRLQYIGVLATGYNIIDMEAATRQNIVVTNIPAYSTESVAQMTFSHILNIVSRADHYARENRQGRWSNSPEFCYLDHGLHELAGKTMGIVGLGNTGMATARIAQAFGMQIIAYTSKNEDALPYGIRKADMDTLFATSDILSLHCPLTAETRNLVNAERLKTMKPTAIVINTGRGLLIDEAAMAEALNNGTIAAFGADVLSSEPPSADNPLLSARNCYLTPHIAWATTEARMRLINICIENVRAFIAGDVINQVN